MKHLIMVLIATAASISMADSYVNGYYRQNGTYVQPHMRSNNDGNIYNNYSTQGNVNPYTGSQGTINPYAQQRQINPNNYYPGSQTAPKSAWDN